MTDKEKLIELLHRASYGAYNHTLEDTHTDKAIEEIAEYLLSNGIIVPPCKVGDVIWDKNGEPHKVISIEWYSKKVIHLHCEHHTFSVGKRSIGKTVFLAREDLEKAF